MASINLVRQFVILLLLSQFILIQNAAPTSARVLLHGVEDVLSSTNTDQGIRGLGNRRQDSELNDYSDPGANIRHTPPIPPPAKSA
uniref:Uncharacterized protein n=1 Tax=Manihot esculenta TaxID=3983 RepID=A0A2C9VWG3_MANES